MFILITAGFLGGILALALVSIRFLFSEHLAKKFYKIFALADLIFIAVIIGRSNIVGKPLLHLLMARHATVTVCHTHTKNLPEIARQADILVAASGKPKLVTADMIKSGATVIDVGINRIAPKKLVGDVDFDAAVEIAGAITPVPGGVGLLTVAMLMKNVVTAAKLQYD